MKTIEATIPVLRMLASLRGKHWMIRPDMIERFALSALEIPSIRADSDEEDDDSDYFPMREPMCLNSNGTAIIWIKGALMDECPNIYEKLGLATRYCTIVCETECAIERGCNSILYAVDSPGGTVAGNQETCEFIMNLTVPTAAHCLGMACSAAYKLSASTDIITAAQSADVGNIGVILKWADCTGFWEEMGIKFKALTNQGADLKSTFHIEPDPTQLAFLQQMIDEDGAQFRAWVELCRPGIDPEVFRAGWYSGTKAESLGLIDGISNMNDAIAAIGSRV